MNAFEAFPKNESQNEKIDQKWFERISEAGNFSDFEYLDGDGKEREKQKTAFLRGEILNPNLDYPKLEEFDFAGKEAALLSLKKDVLSEEKDEVVHQTYRWKINEKLAELRMLEAAKNGNDKRFARYNEFIYGKPNQEIFKYTLQKVIEVASKAQNSEQEMVAGAARRILKEFDGVSLDSNISKENLGVAKLKSLKEEGEFSSDEIAWAFYGALQEYGNDWKINIDHEGGSTAVNVRQGTKEVVIPASRQVKFSKLKSLIAHEIGTHVARRENANRSSLNLLTFGLDRYSAGEEGVSTYEEQKILGANDFAGFDGHLAIALAQGLDGKQRTFREVFSILRDYYFVNSKKDVHEAWKGALDSAWKRTIRTFRGSSCNTPGVCFTKDIVYREGNIGVWNLIKNNPEEERRFMVGKYDPMNPRHIWILEQLGISDKDLEMLDSSEDEES